MTLKRLALVAGVAYVLGLYSGCSLTQTPAVDDPRVHEAQVRHRLAVLEEQAKTEANVISLAYGSAVIGVLCLVGAGGVVGLAVAARVSQEAAPQFARALAIVVEADAKARVLEAKYRITSPSVPSSPQNPATALSSRGIVGPAPDPDLDAPEGGLDLSPDNLYVRDVLVKMIAMVGEDSSRLPSSALRRAKSLSNTYAQPVLNALMERGAIRDHLPGEALGLWVNGDTLGGLLEGIETGELDLTGKIETKRLDG